MTGGPEGKGQVGLKIAHPGQPDPAQGQDKGNRVSLP
jgi:hypothetical protein